jgi:hypothetical protein
MKNVLTDLGNSKYCHQQSGATILQGRGIDTLYITTTPTVSCTMRSTTNCSISFKNPKREKFTSADNVMLPSYNCGLCT